MHHLQICLKIIVHHSEIFNIFNVILSTEIEVASIEFILNF